MATFTTFLSKPPTTLSHTTNTIKATPLQSQHNFSTFTRSNPKQQYFFTKTQPLITICTNATVSPKERQLSNTDERVKQIHSIEDFDEALRSAKDKLVVVEYAASTSYHSRKIYPFMVDLSRTCNDVEFLLVMGDENDKTKELCKREKIEKVPHFSFYKSMQIIHEEEGIGPDELEGDVLYYGDNHSGVEQLHSRDDVEKLIEGHKADHKLIVLDVGLKHCGPCVKVYPTVLKLSKQMGGTVVFARMNGDENESCMEFLKDMEVIEVPTFLFIRDGEICGRYVGSGKGELIGEILSSDHDSSTISTNLRFGRKIINNNNNIVDGDVSEREDQWTEILSWEPRAFLYHNFLSKKECEYLIDLAKPHMAKSTVVDTKTGKSKDSRVRTSSGMFLQRGRDEIISNIEKRIADFTLIPADHGEGLQVLHYEVGQKYELHYDCFLDELNTKNGGPRIATVIMYLSDVEEGGETVFPAAKGNFSSLPGWNEWSDCAKRGLSVKPKMGDALLFWSMRPDASLDPSSLHGSCPVIKGNKWSSTKWLHVDEYKL